MNEGYDSVLKGLHAISRFASQLKEKSSGLAPMCDDWMAIAYSAIVLIKTQRDEIEELESKVWAFETLYNNSFK